MGGAQIDRSSYKKVNQSLFIEVKSKEDGLTVFSIAFISFLRTRKFITFVDLLIMMSQFGMLFPFIVINYTITQFCALIYIIRVKSLTRAAEGKTVFQIKMAEKAAAEKQKQMEVAVAETDNKKGT